MQNPTPLRGKTLLTLLLLTGLGAIVFAAWCLDRDSVRQELGLGEAGFSDSLAPDACARIRDLWGPVAADPEPLRDRLVQAVAALLDAAS